MDFQLSDDQKMLAETVASFAKQSSPVERARHLREDARGWDPKVWRQMGELGWLSVPFPESLEGFDGSMVDVAVVLEKLATTLVPEPYLASVVLGGLTILRAGSPEQQKRWLPAMIAGETSLALAYLEPGGRYGFAAPKTSAKKNGDSYSLNGEKAWVLNGHAADQLVVSATLDGQVALFVVDGDEKGVERTSVKTMDGRRAALIRFKDCAVDSDRRLGDGEGALGHLSSVIDAGAAAACAEGVGIMQTVLAMTTSYLKEREQFGVPIGTFQVLQHRAVDMFVETELSRSMMWVAAVRADETDAPKRERDISAAKAQLGRGGRFVVQEGTQLHGGIGITDEHDIGMYFKRMEVLNSLFGNEEFHLARYANSAAFAETGQ